MRFKFRVLEGPDHGVEISAASDLFLIGSAEGSHLRLTDPAVSPHHCAIMVTPKGFLVRDLGSSRGTEIGNVRVESAYISSGAVMAVGGSSIYFEVLAEVQEEPALVSDRFGDVVGQSPAMRRILGLLPRLAACDCTVLVEGETGTGKGLVAEAIHQHGPRADAPFVVADLGAMPKNLMEVELFGQVFEAARGGTVFLDEIGELPLELQPKLLRVLDKRKLAIDLRVIAATSRNLREEVQKGTFRADLYHRLNTVNLRIPPLRERLEDIPLLVAHFYPRLNPKADRVPLANLLAAIPRSEWPGNVRELRCTVERAMLLGDFPASGERYEKALSFREAKSKVVESWERGYLRELIRRNGGNVSRAARTAKMNRNHLTALLKRYRVVATND
ncbi:MAG: sigma 54-dependent Fis family transcriptional regulator [Deltaproteobacteria bacterium]|nr:sigma 54-dependent Fis family transcriptional regulator [Deltaproteobacteria bacterium]